MSADLQRLKIRFKSMPNRGIDLNLLFETLTKANMKLGQIRQGVIGLPDLAGDLSRMKIQPNVDELEMALKNVRNEIEAVRQAITAMKDKCFRVVESAIGPEFSASLTKRTSAAEQGVNSTKDLLQRRAAPESIWASLQKTASSADPIFAEYVELLGGVALRDTGLDEGISAVVDELWRTFVPGGGKSNFIAIPSRQRDLKHTLARIIRVMLPDWTIWTLPATALEFWVVVASVDIGDSLKAKLGNLSAEGAPEIDLSRMEYLGDAYATYTMGPSYALLAVSLMLDPAIDAHQDRVRAVLHMLECMDNKASELDQPYKSVRRQLLKAWNAARAQFNREQLNLDIDDPSSAATSDPDGAPVRVVVDALWDTLRSLTSAGFVVDVWNEVQDWVPKLLSGGENEISIAAGAEIRHVLSAGWLARVSPDRTLPVEKLTEAVQRLRDRVLGKGK
jgi:hypothetical protein